MKHSNISDVKCEGEIILGQMKWGTSFIHQILTRHPLCAWGSTCWDAGHQKNKVSALRGDRLVDLLDPCSFAASL